MARCMPIHPPAREKDEQAVAPTLDCLWIMTHVQKYDSNPGKVHNLRVGSRPAVHIWSEEEEPTSSSADAYGVAGGMRCNSLEIREVSDFLLNYCQKFLSADAVCLGHVIVQQDADVLLHVRGETAFAHLVQRHPLHAPLC